MHTTIKNGAKMESSLNKIENVNDSPSKKSRAKGYQHSTTVYLPRKHNEFRVRAIRARSAQKFGVANESLGKNSKYIIHLIDKDLFEAGFFDERGEPILAKLQEIEQWISEQAKKPKF